ncbi:hypothetical protein PILCRDRAFT_86583 [Piloderma croceum F 1598]|uniref:Uncharacterized protein n=1 Tax=Piloderma croceum (strain F 1598) TaxID=765440 RepID=A0A0C3BJ98_PILCF|nr:hypothetical protein PILCRDRAFT_86583 [Piloderma croceum F 1598]
MYMPCQVTFVISAFIVNILADTSFCKCRNPGGGSPDNAMTNTCCDTMDNNATLSALCGNNGPDYSSTHNRCDCGTEALYDVRDSVWADCCFGEPGDTYNCEIG